MQIFITFPTQVLGLSFKGMVITKDGSTRRNLVELERCIFSIELPRIIIPLLTMFQQKNTFLYRFLQINISSSREHQISLRISDHAIGFYQYCSLFSFKANCKKVKISLVQCQYCFLAIARRKQMSF